MEQDTDIMIIMMVGNKTDLAEQLLLGEMIK